jgi:hypothetical protein
MKLYVNGQDIAHLTLGLLAEVPVLEHFEIGPEGFLASLSAFLSTHDLMIGDIDSAVVVTGPGSATALRASLAIMNTLAFTKEVKLYGVEKPVDQSDLAFVQSLHVGGLGGSVNELQATYTRGPKITATTRDALRRKL